MIIRTLCALLMAVAATLAVQAPAQAATAGAAPAAAASGSRCPEKAPSGAVFVERVQPPYGLAYEVWRDSNGKRFTIYC